MATRTPLVVAGGQVQQLQSADSFIAVGSFAPGAFALSDGQFAIMAERLILTGTQRVTLAGSSRLGVIT